jgi:hypothetical protein
MSLVPSPSRRRPRGFTLGAAFVAAATLWACDVGLPIPASVALDPEPVSLHLDPAGPLDFGPPVARLVVRGAPPSARVEVWEGSLSDSQVTAIARNEVPKALAKRAIEALTWREGDELVVSPARSLAPGVHTLTLVCADACSPAALEWTVGPHNTARLAERVWPAPGAAGGARLAVVCADEPVPAKHATLALAPGGLEGQLGRAGAGASAAKCLVWSADAAPLEGAWQLPPSLDSIEGRFSLDPSPLTPEPLGPSPKPLGCPVGTSHFGPGCATTLDDRVVVTTPTHDTLWLVEGAGLDRVQVTAGEPLVLAPFVPSTWITLKVRWATLGSVLWEDEVVVGTQAPMARLVVNEVLANPLGAEPACEWVELANTGTAGAWLAGWSLRDSVGEVVLTDGMLAPGQRAVVIGEACPPSGPDVPVDPTALRLPVAKIGNGLSNAGEAVVLVDPSGSIASMAPASPALDGGEAWCRRDAMSPDDSPAGFAVCEPTPGAPNTEPGDGI